MTDKITVYITVGREDRVCQFGDKHLVDFYARKFLYPTGETWICDNGYERLTLPTYRDYQGRVWRKHVTIDYSNNVFYISDEGAFGSARKPLRGVDVTAGLE